MKTNGIQEAARAGRPVIGSDIGGVREKVLAAGGTVFRMGDPLALAEAFRSGRLGVMDYYKMENVQADTRMRGSIAGDEG